MEKSTNQYRKVHLKNNKGNEQWHEYDENDNIIHYKNSEGYEYWYEFEV